MMIFSIGVLCGVLVFVISLVAYWMGCPKEQIMESRYYITIKLKHQVFNMYGIIFSRYIVFGRVVYETRNPISK